MNCFATFLLYSLSKLCTGFELGNLLGSNLDLSLCSGVDALASGNFLYRECSKANELYFVTCYESVLNGTNSSFQCFLCLSLGNTSCVGNLLN